MTLKLSTCLLLIAPLLAAIPIATADPAPQNRPHPLVWDAMEKSIDAKPDQGTASIQFDVTNKSGDPVEILRIEPSCGCTVAEMPTTPWVLAPGAQESFTAVVDYRGKHGKFSKSIFVHSLEGAQRLSVIINIPETEESRRARNQQFAAVDRQSVFRGECASCHVLPTVGKTGAELFQTACAICHMANPRASMVPDLLVAREPRDAEYWRKWISDGKEQTAMPGFGPKHGGPLTAGQIASLVEYAMGHLPTEPRKD